MGDMMTFFRYVAALTLMTLLGTTSFAQTIQSDDCERFTVVFEDKVTAVPSGVYAGEKRIGTVQLPETGNDGLQGLVICIDSNRTGTLEKNTILYLSGDRLMVYNVWATGGDLREGDTLQGFPSRNSVFMHEARVLFHAVMEYALSFVREQLGKLLGEANVQSQAL